MRELSVTIITRNEAANIAACLESVRWAGEVVVVDEFSDDGTADIARAMGARVYQAEWRGYGGQKNLGIAEARGEWILSLDADERVTPPLRREIEATLGRDDACAGYLVPRKNYFCGRWIRHGGWYPDYNLRLFRRGAGRFQERAVHEKVVVEGPVGRLRHPLEHYTYESVADYLERLERYSRLGAEELRASMDRAGWPALASRPLFTFVKMYLLKLGFLDGRAGFFLAWSYAYYTLLKYYRIDETSLDNQPKASG